MMRTLVATLAVVLFLGVSGSLAGVDASEGSLRATTQQLKNAHVKTVHAVFMNHLDVGFDGIDPIEGFAVNVVNKYFDVYYPQAVKVSKQLRDNGRTERLVYTTHSWMASMYLDCPPDMGIHCPSAAQRKDFIDTVKRGDIVWHAFPFNAEPETLDESMAHFAIDMTHALDDQLGRRRSRVMSQRDVPGMTRAMIPVLRKHNVHGISVGVNGGSMPPAVPRVFVWADKASNQDVMVTYNPGGYGGEFVVPGFDHALVFNFRSDNAGPPGYQEVLDNYATMRQNYPNAKIVAGPMDDFYVALEDFKQHLPVITGEIGDTWIYGVPSDPLKNSLVRLIMRERTAYLDSESPVVDHAFGNFSRLLLKASEHTWGGDVKTFLDASHKPLYYQWSNEAFAKVIGAREYQDLIGTWKEQREWAICFAVQALKVGGHPFHSRVDAAIKAFMEEQKTLPSVAGMDTLDLSKLGGQVFHAGPVDVSFDRHTGAIVSLSHRDDQAKLDIAGPNNPLGEMVYQSFTESEYEKFFGEYSYIPPHQNPWVWLDFGKANVSNASPERLDIRPEVREARASKDRSRFVFELAFPKEAVSKYGAPPRVVLAYHLSSNGVDVEYRTVDKTATRLPEALWVRFNPATLGEDTSRFELSKIGSVVFSDNMVKNGSYHLHGVTAEGGVAIPYASHDFKLRFTSPDVPVVSLGRPGGEQLSPFPTPTGQLPSTNGGVAFNLVNNIWGTNYVMHYPFIEEDTVSLFRFRIALERMHK